MVIPGALIKRVHSLNGVNVIFMTDTHTIYKNKIRSTKPNMNWWGSLVLLTSRKGNSYCFFLHNTRVDIEYILYQSILISEDFNNRMFISH